MKKLLCILIVLVTFPVQTVFAQEQESGATLPEITSETAPEEGGYAFPEIKPEATLFGGYRHVESSGSDRAEEYEYLHSSAVLGGELRVFSFPHRFHLDLDIKNGKDYFGDTSYAYEDIILFRGITRNLFHNLDNISLIDLDPSTPSPGVDVRDSGVRYGVNVGMTNAFLRFKTHNFPFHVYLDGTVVDSEGTRQQRFLGGSGSFSDIVRVSQQRDVDWNTKTLVVGANSHLGPIEVDFSHGEMKFDADGRKVFTDYFFQEVPGERAAGIYPHNLVPDFSGSSNTLKLHTSYTGSIVASSTFATIHRKNEDSGAKADYFFGEGEVIWTATPRLAFIAKYRHKDTDIDNPSVVTITNLTNPALSPGPFTVIPSISSNTDTASAVVRYRPFSGLTLRADYTYSDVRRENAEQWELPDSTRYGILTFRADSRIMKGLTLQGQYIHKDIDDPAYNVEPNHSDEGRICLVWLPVPRITALVSYNIAQEKRDDLNFPLAPPTVWRDGIMPENRDVKRDSILGSLTFLLMKDLSLTTSYAYWHDKVTQDIAFGISSDLEGADRGVPYKTVSNSFAANITYVPTERLSMNTGVTYTVSTGAFYPNSPDLLLPVSVASFSDLHIRETIYSFDGEYRANKGVTFGLQYRYSKFDDAANNPFDDISSGQAHIILLTLTKKW